MKAVVVDIRCSLSFWLRHRFNGRKRRQTLRGGDEQRGLACCSHGVTESRTRLTDWTELNWMFFGRDDAKAETPILWPPDEKNWLLGKGSVAEKDWRQEEKGTTEDEMVGSHHWLNGYEFEQAPGVSDGQGSLACWSPWSCQELATTERVNWTEKVIIICFPQSFPFWKILNEYNVMSQLSRGSHETNS